MTAIDAVQMSEGERADLRLYFTDAIEAIACLRASLLEEGAERSLGIYVMDNIEGAGTEAANLVADVFTGEAILNAVEEIIGSELADLEKTS